MQRKRKNKSIKNYLEKCIEKKYRQKKSKVLLTKKGKTLSSSLCNLYFTSFFQFNCCLVISSPACGCESCPGLLFPPVFTCPSSPVLLCVGSLFHLGCLVCSEFTLSLSRAGGPSHFSSAVLYLLFFFSLPTRTLFVQFQFFH